MYGDIHIILLFFYINTPVNSLPPISLSISPSQPFQHELKKKSMEEERRKEAEEKRERVKKTSAALHDMKRASEKRQLEYRGIVNSRAAGTLIHCTYHARYQYISPVYRHTCTIMITCMHNQYVHVCHIL